MSGLADKAKAAVSAVAHGQNPLKASSVNGSSPSGGRQASHNITIPPPDITKSSGLKTPKTPADEGIDFFETVATKDSTIQVYELKLDPDGAPSKEKSVCMFYALCICCSEHPSTLRFQYIRLPPPYVPYVLRISLDAGTPASRNGVFKTNFPINGGVFDRHRFEERK
jgi:glycogen debranching enzyme